MSCCGKARRIAAGYTHLALKKLGGLSSRKCAAADQRIVICHGCDASTWLSWAEYAAHAGRQLPKRGNHKGAKLFCRLCRCFIPAKAYVADEQCPAGKWKDLP